MILEMSEQNSKVLINVLKQTNGAVNDDIFGDQASLINRIQTKSYKGALDGLVDSLTGLRYHENHKIRAPRTTGSSFIGRTDRATLMLVISGCWCLYLGDNFWMLVTEIRYW